MIQEKTFDAGIVTLNYAEGPPSGPPLVLLHGGGDRWQYFQPLLPALKSHGHVYALDLRGHGKSGRVPGSYRPEEYVVDVTAFVERQLDEPVILFGHSLGGWVALLTAAQLGDKVRALVLGDPPLNVNHFVQFEGSEAQVGMWRALRNALQPARSVPELASALAEMTGQEAAGLHEWAEALNQTDPDVILYHAEGRIDEYVRNVDLEGALCRLACPVLLIQGDPAHGAMIADEDAERVLSLLTNGQHVRIEGVGHDLGLNTGETVSLLDAMTGFLETLGSKPEM
jgi:pimeloyl-ACP methyl ester carboxylesterase